MTQIKILRTVLFGLAICLASCKLVQDDSKQASQDTGEFEQSTTLAISEEIPTELQAFIEVVSGKSKRMHDSYFSQVFRQKFGSKIKISSDVLIEYTKEAKTERGNIPFKVTDVYRGVVVGDRVLVFQKTRESGCPAEAGPWWHAVKSYPMSLLVNKSVEEKIKFGLNTEIYEKREIGKTMEQLDAVEFGLNFVPMYGGAKDYFYDGKSSGVVWMIGDAASLGLGSKIKAVANTSRAIVISASSVRIANGINQATQGTATASTGVDVALATLEGTLAAVGFINIKFKLKGGVKANSVDDIIENMGAERVIIADRESAELVARRLGRSADDVATNGLSRDELAKVANKRELAETVGMSAKARVIGKLGSRDIKRIAGVNLTSKALTPDDLRMINEAMGLNESIVVVLKQVDMNIFHWELAYIDQLGKWTKRSAGFSTIRKGFVPTIGEMDHLQNAVVFKPNYSAGEFAQVKARFFDRENTFLKPHISCAQDACSIAQNTSRSLFGSDASANLCRKNLENILDDGFKINGRTMNMETYQLSDMPIEKIGERVFATDIIAGGMITIFGVEVLTGVGVIAGQTLGITSQDNKK